MPSARALSRSASVANARPSSNRSVNAAPAPSATNNATAPSPTLFAITVIASRAACLQQAGCVAVGERASHRDLLKGPATAGSGASVATVHQLCLGLAGD